MRPCRGRQRKGESVIKNPHYENMIWNPLINYSLGEDTDGGPVAILSCIGEGGETVTLCIPNKNYLAGLIEILMYGVVDMETMELKGFAAASEIADNRSITQASAAPDDLAGLDWGSGTDEPSEE
jgi:hypothetical protein